VGSNFDTKASPYCKGPKSTSPPKEESNAPGVTGKFGDTVSPTIQTLPERSTAIACASSPPEPPR
jgi:hypothetical protein